MPRLVAPGLGAIAPLERVGRCDNSFEACPDMRYRSRRPRHWTLAASLVQRPAANVT